MDRANTSSSFRPSASCRLDLTTSEDAMEHKRYSPQLSGLTQAALAKMRLRRRRRKTLQDLVSRT